MAKSKICDFCLEEQRGLFNHLSTTLDGFSICRSCRRKIEKYNLPLKHDLFQILVTSDPDLHTIIMKDYLENHTPEETIAKFFPLPEVPLHDGENCVNAVPATLTVDEADIPMDETAVTTIAEVTRSKIHNVCDSTVGPSTSITARLYETDAAVYFLTNHFVNCHRLSNVVRSSTDDKHITVLEDGKGYTYAVEDADMFRMRSEFFGLIQGVLEKKKNLIYMKSENTMTITPGIYNVPRHIQAGTYYVSAVKDDGLHIRDAAGKFRNYNGSGRVYLDEGSQLEVTGEYQFRIKEVANDILSEAGLYVNEEEPKDTPAEEVTPEVTAEEVIPEAPAEAEIPMPEIPAEEPEKTREFIPPKDED